MFQQVNVPIIGVIENMAAMSLRGSVDGQVNSLTIEGPDGAVQATLEADGNFSVELPIFGAGGGDAIAERFGVPLLGRVPLDPAVRAGGDAGKPVTVEQPDSIAAQRLREVAGQLAMRVSTLNLQSAPSMPV